MAQTDTHSESKTSNSDSKQSKPERSMISMETDSEQGVWGVQSVVQLVDTPEAWGSGNTIVVYDDVVTVDDTD